MTEPASPTDPGPETISSGSAGLDDILGGGCIGTTAMVGCAHLVSVPAAAAIVSGGHFQKTETNET